MLAVYQAFSVIVGVWVCPSVRPQSVTLYARSEYDYPPDYRRFVVAWFPQERTDGCLLEALAAAVAVSQIQRVDFVSCACCEAKL